MNRNSVPKRPILIAHRGAPERFPENTIVGYQAAIEAGAEFVELDVQLTQDKVPILHHDQDLLRITGTPGDITAMNSVDVLKRRASYREKFADHFADNPLATLSEFVHWLSQYPYVTAFVEIKRKSAEIFGSEQTAETVLAAIEPIRNKAIVISFHNGVIEATRRLAPTIPIGWVIPDYNETNHQRADQLKPDYLFCKTTRIPTDRNVWPTQSQWVLYNTDTVADAMDYFRSGFSMLETNKIVDLLASPEYAKHD